MGYSLKITYLNKPTLETWNKSLLKMVFKAFVNQFDSNIYSIEIDRISQRKFVFGSN